MDLTKSILEDVRAGVGLSSDIPDFDTDLVMLINSSLGILNQNGVGKSISIQDTTTTWGDFKDELQVIGNDYFHLVPTFVTLSCKVIFDPPPPSAVDYFKQTIDQMLWRLKIAYEETEETL